jgi:hypothetical protein
MQMQFRIVFSKPIPVNIVSLLLAETLCIVDIGLPGML